MGDLILILGLSLLIGASHIFAIMFFWRRFAERLRMQEPRVAKVVVRSFGADAAAVARALARHTRLDVAEIDEIVAAAQTGPLPLPLSARAANLLVADLRRLGGQAEVVLR